MITAFVARKMFTFVLHRFLHELPFKIAPEAPAMFVHLLHQFLIPYSQHIT
jgi:hypothetical protein